MCVVGSGTIGGKAGSSSSVGSCTRNSLQQKINAVLATWEHRQHPHKRQSIQLLQFDAYPQAHDAMMPVCRCCAVCSAAV
jgi:hypothetical protein